jgi:hypothetical protein
MLYVKNQEKEDTVIKKFLETHKEEVYEMVKGTDAFGPRFDRLSEMVTKRSVIECGVSCEELENKLRQRDEGKRRTSKIIFWISREERIKLL